MINPEILVKAQLLRTNYVRSLLDSKLKKLGATKEDLDLLDSIEKRTGFKLGLIKKIIKKNL